MILTALILLLITAQRLFELGIAHRNTVRLLARGGVESGAEHYLWIVGLHTAWVVGLWLVAWRHPPAIFWLLAYLGIQALRIWTMRSLGDRWTTRIITLPGESLVRKGPYRFLAHPNYMVVAAEIAVAPLIFGAPVYALVFFGLNAAVMWIRIRDEDAALARAAGSEAGAIS